MFGTNTLSGGFGAQQAPAFGAAPATGAFGSSFGAFGQQQQQPAFGASPAPAFGAASAPAFGATQTPAFGAASTPAFGATAAPAFGAQSSSAFGGASTFGARPATTFGGFGSTPSTFGASQPAFGSTLGTSTFGASQPAFGASAAPAFGASSAPAFGSTPGAFGGASQAPSPFGGTSTFGAASQPAFGMPGSTGLFGAAATPAASAPFGSTGTTPGLFGAGGLGTPGAAGATGSRAAPYQKTVERDGQNNTGAPSMANFITITAMPQYQNKSQEELRWEDYQAGVRSAASGPAQPAAQSFGSPAGGTTAFGASTGVFGTPAASTPSFGSPAAPAFGATNTGLFGSQPAAAPAFGASSTPAFGSANPFGAASAPAFGAPSTAPAFGAANPFGAASTPAFGSATAAARPATSPSLFSFNTSPTGAFGAASTAAPAFGTTAAAPSLFGGTTAPAGGLFGGTPGAANPFGSTLATPSAAPSAFGGTSPFGAKPAAPAFGTPGAGFGASTGSAFGSSLFGQTAGGSLFNPSSFPAAGTSSPSLFASSSPSLFGGAAGGSMFGGQQGQQPSQFGTGLAMQPWGQAATAATAQPAAAPNVSTAPYGAFPSLPTVPEPKVGITSRPARPASASGASGAARASPLVSLRATASGATSKLGAVMASPRGGSISPLGSLGVISSETNTTSMSLGTTPNTNSTPGLLRPRANPHQLFIREPPPGTHTATNGSAFSPVRTPAAPTNNNNHVDRTPHPNNGNSNGAGPSGANGNGTPYNPFTPLSGGTRTPGTAGTPGGVGSAQGGASVDHGGEGGERLASVGSGRRSKALVVDEDADHSYLPMLGRLATEDCYYEPSATQLAAMHQADPESLSRVSNFTVGREGVGSIRWLQPVDVRGLQLDQIVSIQKGEVACYTQGQKPPVGQGLNVDAAITLLGIYKIDKDTNTAVHDGAALIKWEKALRGMCAKMGAKFVSYKSNGGVWKFEVEHFSRYGLILDDDDDDEDYDLGNADDDGMAAADRVMVLEDEEEGEDVLVENGLVVGLQTQGGSYGRLGASGDGPLSSHRSGRAPPTAALQHALPTHLALEPTQLLSMRQAYFSSGATSMDTSFDERLRNSTGPTTAPAPGPAGGVTPRAGVSTGASVRQVRLWRTPPPALTSGRRPLRPVGGATAELAMAVASPGPHILSPRDRDQGGAGAISASHHHMDAGMSLGLSFRVGWGPDGSLAIPGPPGLRMGSGAQPVSVRRVLVEGVGSGYGSDAGADSGMDVADGNTGVPPKLAALRVSLRGLLTVHLRHSVITPTTSTDSNSSTTALPQWCLKCSAEDLPALVSELVLAAQAPGSALAAFSPNTSRGGGGVVLSGEEEEALAQLSGDDDWQGEVQHAVETWRLLKVLFEAHPAGAPTPAADADDDSNMDGAGATPPAHLAITLHRQSGFSRWLQQQVLPDVQSALRGNATPASSSEAVLLLLSGHHLAGAAAVAAAAGDVRLASLVACAGLHAASQAEAAQQLEVWAATGMTSKIAPERLLVYALLAGQVVDVIRHLSLDWRRALGLFLWYRSHTPDGTPSNAPRPVRNQPGTLSLVLSLYQQHLLEHQPVPLPLPPHAREQLPSMELHRKPTDLQYTLMQLWVAADQSSSSLDTSPQPQPVPPELLASSSHSSNPCAAALPWTLLTVLQSLGVISLLTDNQLASATDAASRGVGVVPVEQWERWELLLRAHMGLVAELLLAGEMCEWAVYVALHLPDVPTSSAAGAGGRVRGAVVRQLLAVTAPQWVGNVERETFLTQVLGVPQVLLSEAGAGWALAQGDIAAAVRQHLLAHQWQAAHALLVTQLAPMLMCENKTSELREVLIALQPHASSCIGWRHGGSVYLAYIDTVITPIRTTTTSSEVLQRLATDLAEARAQAAAGLNRGPTPLPAVGAPVGADGALSLYAGAAGGVGVGRDKGGGVLVQLSALEMMGRRVQGALMHSIGTQLAGSGGGGGGQSGVVLPDVLSAFSRQSARSSVINLAAYQLAQQVLAAV